MRISDRELIRKLLPLNRGPEVKVHNEKLLLAEFERRYFWKHRVIEACDNAREFYPIGQIYTPDWRNSRLVKFPKKKYIHPDILSLWNRRIAYHIVRISRGRLKIVELKKK